MKLPDELKSAIEKNLTNVPRQALQRASTALSDRYRSPNRDQLDQIITSDADRLAYLAVRMPATYAVVKRVLNECKQRLPLFSPSSLVDIGAGPGTATWAAVGVFPELKQATLYENDSQWFQLGQEMMRQASHSALKDAVWKQADLRQHAAFSQEDLAILSYVVGELSLDAMASLIEDAWRSTSQVLVVVEPGTPRGFQRIRAVRDQLLALGASLVAPCPHQRECPMKDGDWCHFAERLERSPMHRDVKGVQMGYEDEKYSYIAAAKIPVILPEARIVRHPQIHSGHVDFVLCAQSGLEKKIVSKKMGDIYKQARKASWGDAWPPAE